MRSGVRDLLNKSALARLGPAVEREVHEAKARRKRRHAEEVLRETTSRLEGVAANIPGMIFKRIQHGDGTLTYPYISDGVFQLYGYTPQEFKADPTLFSEHVVDDVDGVRKMLSESERLLQPYVYTGLERRKDGTQFWARTSARPRRSAADIIWDGIVLDISDLKRAESQLVQSAKLASLGEMAAGLTHELTQPLSVLTMAVDAAIMMEEEDGTPSVDFLMKQIHTIGEQAARMREMVDHIGAFSRKDDAKAEIFDPAIPIHNAIRFVADLMRMSNVVIEERVPEGIWHVRGYPVQFEQIMVNLLGNAKDAIIARRITESEKVCTGRIAVRLEADSDDQRIRLEVQDDGGGIPGDVVKHIFEPFFTTKPVGKGTGLGLSIVYSLVTSIGGEITAENDGEGALFTIRLPMHTGPLDTDDDSADRS